MPNKKQCYYYSLQQTPMKVHWKKGEIMGKERRNRGTNEQWAGQWPAGLCPVANLAIDTTHHKLKIQMAKKGKRYEYQK